MWGENAQAEASAIKAAFVRGDQCPHGEMDVPHHSFGVKETGFMAFIRRPYSLVVPPPPYRTPALTVSVGVSCFYGLGNPGRDTRLYGAYRKTVVASHSATALPDSCIIGYGVSSQQPAVLGGSRSSALGEDLAVTFRLPECYRSMRPRAEDVDAEGGLYGRLV